MLLDVVDEGTALQAAARQLSARRQDGNAARNGARPLRSRPLQSELRRHLSGRRSAVRDRREAHRAAELDLRRRNRGARDEGHSRRRRSRRATRRSIEASSASSVMPTRKRRAETSSKPVRRRRASPPHRAAPRRRSILADASRLARRRSLPFVVTLPLRSAARAAAAVRAVPDVRGLDLRDAVRSLHSAGFRVQLAGRRRSRCALAGRRDHSRGRRARPHWHAGSLALHY